LQLVFEGKNRAKVHRIKRKSFIGQAVIVLLGVEVLFLSSFTALELPTATARNLELFVRQTIQLVVNQLPERLQGRIYRAVPEIAQPAEATVRYNLYVPQAPAAIFIGYALGWPLATVAAGLFVLLGLVAPFFNVHPFAAGGGVDYYLQPGFGYLIGIILATAAVGSTTKDRRTTFSQILATVVGLLIIHLVGLAYLLGICLFFSFFQDLHGFPVWAQWVFEQARNLSWYSLPYDFAFALIAVGIGFPFRWLANVLVAPDIAVRHHRAEQSWRMAGPMGG
jgi:biotin transport system substrate-specific component